MSLNRTSPPDSRTTKSGEEVHDDETFSCTETESYDETDLLVSFDPVSQKRQSLQSAKGPPKRRLTTLKLLIVAVFTIILSDVIILRFGALEGRSMFRPRGETTKRRSYKEQLMEHWIDLEAHALATKSSTPRAKSFVNFIAREVEVENAQQVVITMHASANHNKLSHLITNLRKWNGPGSIALYIQSAEDVELIGDWLANHTIASFLRESNVHIFMEKIVDYSPYPEPTMQWTYPYNSLRNLGLENIGADYFLLLDVDLIVPPDSFAKSRELFENHPDMLRAMSHNRHLFVLPAFEVCPGGVSAAPEIEASESDLPESKKDLVRMVGEKTAWVIYSDEHVLNQGASNAEKWYTFTESTDYPIEWQEQYEPYVIGYLSAVPRFWTEFRGYGYDKESWYRELHRAGFTMSVLRDFYVVHLCHFRTPITVDWKDWPNTKKFVQFDPFLISKYGLCRDWCRINEEQWKVKCGWDSCAQCTECVTNETCPANCKDSDPIPWEERCAWHNCVGKCPQCLDLFRI
ncbi:hypothetical protein FisN_35Hh027 [Fistulifera solaris]|uniref:Beta-1,4-glucuronyltransferase 1 n=1 Tax=Fistulifera solaris TaxID=1519565 RepID=A0A1Z5JQN3_FISSO|nr:hypothetical protein FisN_35Hh027 [Fistulifera solaris]|eukprot:GAX16324.1 hypothetical protein FisN_35Hh027 [Fistulifera solaris]